MDNIKMIRKNHVMVTAENAVEGVAVVVNNNGCDWDFRKGVITLVEKTPKSWVFVTIKTDAGDVRKKVRKESFYTEDNPFSIDGVHVSGEQSDIYIAQ